MFNYGTLAPSVLYFLRHFCEGTNGKILIDSRNDKNIMNLYLSTKEEGNISCFPSIYKEDESYLKQIESKKIQWIQSTENEYPNEEVYDLIIQNSPLGQRQKLEIKGVKDDSDRIKVARAP